MNRSACALGLLAFAIPALAAPTGRVEGRVYIGTTPARHARVLVQEYGSRDPEHRYEAEVEADAEGRFTARDVPAGRYRVSRLIEFKQTTSQGASETVIGTHGARAEVAGGGVTSVTIGGSGRALTGRLVAGPGLAGRRLAFTAGDFRFLTPVESLKDGFPGRVLILNIDADGSIRCEDVPPGEYSLFVSVKDFDGRLDGPDIGHVSRKITVPDDPGGGRPHDLGRIDLEASRAQ